MRYCTHCGHVLEPNSHYCDFCSSVLDFSAPRQKTDKPYFCVGCGGLLPPGMTTCPVCGCVVGTVPPPTPADTDDHSTQTARRFSVFPSGTQLFRSTALATAGALLVSVVVLLLWRFLPYFLSGNTYALAQAALYVKSDGRLLLSYPDSAPYQLAADYTVPNLAEDAPAARASSDGRRLAYLDAATDGGTDGSLYWVDLSRIRQRDFQPAPVLLAENACSGFAFLDGGSSLVLRTTSGDLFLWNGKKAELLDTGVSEIFSVGSRQILYAKKGERLGVIAQSEIYLRTIGTEEAVPITHTAAQLLDYSADYTFFLYAKPVFDPVAHRYNYEICSYNAPLFQTQTIASGVSEVLEASAQSRTVLFSRESTFVPTCEEYLLDPLAIRDKMMLPPDPDDFGLPENFRSIFEDGPDSSDRLQELAQSAEYDEAYVAYRTALRLYEEKEARDHWRQRAQEDFSRLAALPMRVYGLYYYAGDMVHTLDEDILSLDSYGRKHPLSAHLQTDADGRYAAYSKTSVGDLPSPALSDWTEDSAPNLSALFTTDLPQRLCVASLADAAVAPAQTAARRTDALYTDYFFAGQQLFFRAVAANLLPGELYCLPLNGAELPTPLLVDTAVDALLTGEPLFNAALLYTKRGTGGRNTLYGITTRHTEELTPAVLVPELVAAPLPAVQNSGRTLLYYRRYTAGENTLPGRGDLFLHTRQEDRMVIGDVYGYDYRADRLIYLLRNRNDAGAFELQVYREGGVSTVDTELRMLLPIGN